MKNDMRDIIDSTMLPPEVKKRLDEKAAATSAKTKLLGRFVALAILVIGALVIALGMGSCTDDYDEDDPDAEWYLNGVWQDNDALDEDMVFYTDGTGYWESVSTGAYLDFDYCYGDWIYFTFYPAGAPSYELSCRINFIDDWNIYIVWPPDSFYGPVTVYYTRID